jgi:hypothetical protein
MVIIRLLTNPKDLLRQTFGILLRGNSLEHEVGSTPSHRTRVSIKRDFFSGEFFQYGLKSQTTADV